MTGGDTICARFLHREFFDFRPEFKLWLATNHKPVIKGTDEAIWDRIRLVPFTVRITDDEQDKRLFEKLKAEAPGILRWAVEGCLAWQREGGLGTPIAVDEATTGYRREMDVLGQLIEERCVVAPQALGKAKDLFETYKAWCEAAGERPVTQGEFGRRLTERGFERRHRASGWWWVGIELLTQADPSDPETPDTRQETPREEKPRNQGQEGSKGSRAPAEARGGESVGQQRAAPARQHPRPQKRPKVKFDSPPHRKR